ncbi:hypothetical protein F5B19DRAFT_505654 [Rostrohypoxylon terebratum]|nr:hypothetical protein F5B19DRAFT_505654 [Rostrohypoxylon terebratum]
MIILLGPSVATKLSEGAPPTYNPDTTMEWLQEYGDRLWAMPEVPLCSPEHRKKLYLIGMSGPPEQTAKRNFPARAVWRDADLVCQLVDHLESTIHLSPLELVSIALKCLVGQQTPKFKRLLCVQPTSQDAQWSRIEDTWDVQLGDIEPRYQVAGIVDDQTVTPDGAFGATILWDRMEQVPIFKGQTPGHTIAKLLLRILSIYLIIRMASIIVNVQSTQQLSADLNQGSRSTDNSVGICFVLIIVMSIHLLGMAAMVLFLAP